MTDITGTSGNDILVGTAAEEDFDGLAGSDTVDYRGSTQRVVVNLNTGVGSDGFAAGDTYTSIERVFGTEAGDRLFGNDSDNWLFGYSGADLIGGGGGSDTINGGAGDDRLYGGAGDDTLNGGAGDDLFVGSTGDDTAHGGDGNDTYIYARGDGADIISEDIGDDVGNDIVRLKNITPDEVSVIAKISYLTGVGGELSITLMNLSIADNDAGEGGVIYFRAPVNELHPFSGGLISVERIIFDDGTEWIGADIYNQGAASLSAAGTSGDDTFLGSYTVTGFNGGAGFDTVDYHESPYGVTVNLNANNKFKAGNGSSGMARDDSYVSIEGVIGSDHDDTLVGDGRDNRLNGGEGDDILSGGAGDDILIGGAGRDTLNGGTGFDTVDYSDAKIGLIVNLNGGGGYGAAFGDTVNLIEKIVGTEFGDWIVGFTGADTLLGGGGNDTLEGGAGNDTLNGGAGDDTLNGGTGDDLLSGGAGDDKITGGEGNDTLDGGAGDDILFGGFGADTFVFAQDFGTDRVEDYNDDLDIFEADASLTLDTLYISGDDVVLDYGDDGEITFVDYADDFAALLFA